MRALRGSEEGGIGGHSILKFYKALNSGLQNFSDVLQYFLNKVAHAICMDTLHWLLLSVKNLKF